MTFDPVAKFLVGYQHFLFYPVMALARFNLYAQGYILILIKNTAEWKKLEITGVIFYWTWVSWMLSHCLSWPLLISCLILSHAIAGILHVQICLSHFSMEIFTDVSYRNDDEQFFDTQLKTCIDIDCPIWMDWFHGGLQFQTAHHIFPRVPRHRLRELREKVENFCQKYGRTYHSASFWDTNLKTLKCLKKAALEARSGKLVKFEDSMIWEGMCAKG
jgi:delta8-fatty-acid desaturase